MLSQLKSSVLARNTLWMSLGYGARLVIQAAYFVTITRSLGVEGFGAFVGVMAFVVALSSFSSLGTGNLLVKNVSRDETVFNRYWGNALTVTLLCGSVLVGVVLLVSGYILPDSISTLLVLSVAVSDLLFSRILAISSDAFLAFQRTGWAAQLQVLLSLSRLGAALWLALLTASPSPQEWGLLYLLSTALSALVGMWIVHQKLGAPKLDLAAVASELREGLYFSVSSSCDRTHEDIDKTMLARLSTLEAAGAYAAAYRLIDVSFAPVLALLASSYARFFQYGATGVGGSLGYTKRILPYAAAYSLFVALALYMTAPLLPHLLGDDFQSSVEAARWLAVLPLLRTAQYFAAETLTGAGFQGLRSSVQVLVVLFSVLTNFFLIPIYSWHGAVWVSLASETLLLSGLWGLVWYLYWRKERFWAA